jgi:uncharacterized protein
MKQPVKKRITTKRWFLRSVITLFVLMNVSAIFHGYTFTHFSDAETTKTSKPKELTAADKVKALLFGVNNPKPVNNQQPTVDFETISIKSNREISCWYIEAPEAKGSVILFHGYSGNKAGLLDKASMFQKLGYNTLLVDFMGCGDSEGNQTTIGYYEAKQVKSCFEYLTSKGEENIYLFGTSMGAVAILKAIHDYGFEPKGILIECPFGTMYETVCARFDEMEVPSFPMAGLLTFWGGAVNGFWAFDHNPSTYAKSVKCPTLLMHGAKDTRVSIKEIVEIFGNLQGEKDLVIYPEAGHENYLNKYKDLWKSNIGSFLLKCKMLQNRN